MKSRHETVQNNKRQLILVERCARPPVLSPALQQENRSSSVSQLTFLPTAPLKYTTDTCITPHVHWLFEIDRTIGAIATVQKLWRGLPLTEIAKKEVNLQRSLARCVLRDDTRRTSLAAAVVVQQLDGVADSHEFLLFFFFLFFFKKKKVIHSQCSREEY